VKFINLLFLNFSQGQRFKVESIAECTLIAVHGASNAEAPLKGYIDLFQLLEHSLMVLFPTQYLVDASKCEIFTHNFLIVWGHFLGVKCHNLSI
jgi:hypothetical protein